MNVSALPWASPGTPAGGAREQARWRLAVVLAAALGLAGCGGSGDSRPDPRAAPDFALSAVDGHTVRLSDYRGRVVLLHFWATWCVPCKEAIPHEMELQERLGPRGFAVLGISLDRDPAEVAAFLRQQPVNYPILRIDEATRAAFGGVPSIPYTVLVDREGRIRQKKLGSDAGVMQSLERMIEFLLSEETGVVPYGS